MAVNAKTQYVPSMGITMFYPYLCVPVGGALTVIQFGIQMSLDVLQWRTKRSPYKVEID
jgi:TRAP-type C4-dicarboxylate transport system permease small subunit